VLRAYGEARTIEDVIELAALIRESLLPLR
jgi:hypothetical protein